MFHTLCSSWSPFGDKTPIGWTITIAYFITTALVFWAYRCDRRLKSQGIDGVCAPFWYWLGWVVLALGVNKQLDLQRLVTRFGRVLAFTMHLYEHRRPFQFAFIVAVAFTGLTVVTVLTLRMRGLRARYFWALLGVGFLTVFVVVRAASFHHVDKLLGMSLHHVYTNTFLELGGILWIAAAAASSPLSEAAVRRSTTSIHEPFVR